MFSLDEVSPSIKARILSAGLPLKTIGMEFSDLDPSVSLEEVKKWVGLTIAGEVIRAIGKPTCGLGLMLVGEPGHGKTTMASVAVQALIRADAFGSAKSPVSFMDYPKLLRLQKSLWNEEDEIAQAKIESIFGESGLNRSTQVFILDDLGKEYRTASGWAENTFDALLRSRFNSGLPTIVTTNIPFKQWGTVYGEPMGSFAHEAFIPLSITSLKGDRRK